MPYPIGTFVLDRVRPMTDEGRFAPETSITVKDGIIADVGTEALSNAPRIDGEGQYLLPGFADVHVHLGCFTPSLEHMMLMNATRWTLEVARNARTLLELGITLARDVATSDAGIRDGISSGAVPGPTLRVSGPALGQTGGHTDGYLPSIDAPAMTGFLMPAYPGRGEHVVDGIDEMRKAVRGHIRSGVDWIKLCTTGGLLSTMGDIPTKAEFSFDEVRVAVEEASRAGIPVAAHAYGGEGLDNAIAAGVTSVEHGMLMTAAQADRMAERGIWLVPTLIVVQELAALADAGELPTSAAHRVREVIELSGRQVELASQAGVRIAVGSDLTTQGRNLEELALLTQAGMRASDVLIAATRGGAELMGLGATHGRIAPGYIFDAVLMKRNPLEDMDVFLTERPVTTVFQRGRIVRS
ncbi:amidohydrolase family protein [Microbacterium sp. 13-71-7]|jgi:imidazolonepropionase-like amidohydrolase|uniref:metal-dependent hydrolase family protein n=1 Tax=Microbacterium sp. 13-71-7 TaxID=1970399 RepID=UPI0025F907A3|nr:amidohydrolase family protein [Microbacterium sp. 13-71-7]